MEIVPLLKQLSETPGISGYEQAIRDLVREAFGRFADEVREDKLGNLIALKQGDGEPPRRRLMLAAHMDEIGLMVSGIEKGFLRITPVGGTDRRLLWGQQVTVHGRRDLPGIVGSRPPHVLPPDQRDKVLPWEELFVDVGLPPEEVEKLVRVGDLISFRQEALELKGDLFSGKALDNRASVAALILALEALSPMRHAWDVYAVATVQEEVGLFGAMTSAYGLAPDAAIAVDVTFGRQNGVSEEESFALGKGPTIAYGPNIHPRLFEELEATAKALEIPHQVEPIPGRSGTDAWAIQVSREGVPTGLVSIPLRYMHSPVETVNLKDLERTARLLAGFVARLEPDFLKA
ncbi:MAG: M42 family peptidase [Chloroflexi bacterium]|nr:MAG: M42 family peptidase [Chloroflexota bacterium]